MVLETQSKGFKLVLLSNKMKSLKFQGATKFKVLYGEVNILGAVINHKT